MPHHGERGHRMQAVTSPPCPYSLDVPRFAALAWTRENLPVSSPSSLIREAASDSTDTEKMWRGDLGIGGWAGMYAKRSHRLEFLRYAGRWREVLLWNAEEVFDWPRMVMAATSRIFPISRLGSGSTPPTDLVARLDVRARRRLPVRAAPLARAVLPVKVVPPDRAVALLVMVVPPRCSRQRLRHNLLSSSLNRPRNSRCRIMALRTCTRAMGSNLRRFSKHLNRSPRNLLLHLSPPVLPPARGDRLVDVAISRSSPWSTSRSTSRWSSKSSSHPPRSGS